MPKDTRDRGSSSWPDADSTARILAASVEASALAVLRGARTLAPSQGPPPDEDAFGEISLPPHETPSDRPTETPRTIVLSTVVRADRGTLTIVAGPNAGALFTLENDETILGRDGRAGITVDDPSVSRRHARITRDDRAHHFIEDLGSTNGTFVGGRRVRRAALVSGDRLQLGRDTVFRFAVVDREEEQFQRNLYEASMRDTLTDLPNRRNLVERLAGEVAHARRNRSELALLLIDLDHFKTVNDELGHLAGDEVLRAVADAGLQGIRAGDVFARFGGEEFVVLARDLGKPEARLLAERLRRAIQEARVETPDREVRITASIGVAVLSECVEDGGDGTQLLARADSRLYVAKISGRNQTCGDGP